tara:strand:+ start:399 stop:551 length:153 start_codon:yes stop_codon:yes gene_type:complete
MEILWPEAEACGDVLDLSNGVSNPAKRFSVDEIHVKIGEKGKVITRAETV